MSVSFRHLGQNKGKFINCVSERILIRVLLPHTGHSSHSKLPLAVSLLIFPATAFVAQYNAADDTEDAQHSAPLGREHNACRHQASANNEIAHGLTVTAGLLFRRLPVKALLLTAAGVLCSSGTASFRNRGRCSVGQMGENPAS